MTKTKSIKRATAILMAVIMMFASLGSNAFATGVLTQSFGMENAKYIIVSGKETK